LARIAVRRGLAVLCVGFLSLVLNVSVTLLLGIPKPAVHDEFSYLLAADTFLHGRLSNPPHPMRSHFETMHVLQQPTYASKYPPGQGLLLAAGKLIGGRFIVGSYLGAAIGCAATCWMLMAWVRPRWALIGGLLCALHPNVLGWGQSYFGGALPLLGGSLLLGGARRAALRPGHLEGLAMGLGISVLALSRPYEGMILSVASMVMLTAWLRRCKRRHATGFALRLLTGLLPALLIAAAFILLNNRAVTGRFDKFPYAVYEDRYSTTPLFLVQDLNYRYIDYDNREMYRFYQWTLAEYMRQKSTGSVRMILRTFVAALALQFPGVDLAREVLKLDPAEIRYVLWTSFPWPLLQVPLLLNPWIAFRRGTLPATLLLAVFTCGLSIEVWRLPHYAAPAMGLMLVLTLRSLRQWRLCTFHGWRVGLAIARALLLLALLCPLLLTFNRLGQDDKISRFASNRARLVSELQDGRKHLVIVRYSPSHSFQTEWVYNEADIDSAAVVWARDLGPERNARLRRYFGSRTVWLLEADERYPHLVPYNLTSRNESGRGDPLGRPSP
jgi:hypothetical protein